MKSILQVLSTYPPAWGFGGAPRMMYEYSKLLKTNYHIYVATTDVNKGDSFTLSDDEKLKNSENFTIRYFKNTFPILQNKFNINISISLFIYCVINCRKFNYVHLAEYRGLLPTMCILMKILNKDIIFIHSGFGLLSFSNKSFGRRLLNKIYDNIFKNIFFRNLDIALCENKNEINIYRINGFNGPCHIIRHIVDYDRKVLDKIRGKSNINCLTICRIHRTKGLINNINLIAELNKTIKNKIFNLNIIGNDDGEKDYLQSYINKKNLNKYIKILKPIYDDSRFSFYDNADIFILLPISNLETSVASIEALSRNCFCVLNSNSKIEGIEKFKAGYYLKNNYNVYKLFQIFCECSNGPYNLYTELYSKNMIEKSLYNVFDGYNIN